MPDRVVAPSLSPTNFQSATLQLFSQLYQLEQARGLFAGISTVRADYETRLACSVACQAYYVDLFQPYQVTTHDPGTTDVVADHSIMKHLDTPRDDNLPLYIFLLLFAIFLLSFLATADFRRSLDTDST
jgi:hypothetical protein